MGGIAAEMNITIKLMSREDGGLRVCSDDVPGLILSGADPSKVCADIWPVVQALLAHNGVPK